MFFSYPPAKLLNYSLDTPKLLQNKTLLPSKLRLDIKAHYSKANKTTSNHSLLRDVGKGML